MGSQRKVKVWLLGPLGSRNFQTIIFAKSIIDYFIAPDSPLKKYPTALKGIKMIQQNLWHERTRLWM